MKWGAYFNIFRGCSVWGGGGAAHYMGVNNKTGLHRGCSPTQPTMGNPGSMSGR